MDSTSWAVSYFRSLKANNVLNQLTKYLLQYKQVIIPSVGTIRLVQLPAQLDVADKIIQPPGFSAELKKGDLVSEHQLNYLAAVLKQEREDIWQELAETGLWLKEKIHGDGFDWKGIGLLRQNGEALAVPVAGLNAIPAERVLREDAAHKLLVGDQQMTSTEMASRKAADGEMVESRRSIYVVAGWIILLLAILYIVFVLYQGKFRVGASGAKQAPTGFVRHPNSFGPGSRL